MHPNNAIEVKELTKTFNSVDKKNQSEAEIVAIKSISFSATRGKVFGIIGENGSGKSTLLKLLSGILKPSAGEIKTRGRVASVLDIGSGFHPDLSGYENIFMAGALLGMSTQEIEGCYDEIVRFSGIKKSMHSPIKYYSSGMYMRLAFSVFSHLPTDILLLDEVLSVGDAAFAMQAAERMKDLKVQNKTIVLASHDLNAVKELCDDCLVLEGGKKIYHGTVSDAVITYVERSVQTYIDNIEVKEPVVENSAKEVKDENAEEILAIENQPEPVNEEIEETIKPALRYRNVLNGNEHISSLSLNISAKGKEDFESADELIIQISFSKGSTLPVTLGLVFAANLITPLFTSAPTLTQKGSPEFYINAGVYNITCVIPAFTFNHGIFGLDVFFIGKGGIEIMHFRNALIFSVHYNERYLEQYNYNGKFPGGMLQPLSWNTQ